MIFLPGDQVAYTPFHGSRQTEYGFVTSCKADTVYVRYWKPKPQSKDDLRTKTSSEATPIDTLKLHRSVPCDWVLYWMMELGYWDNEQAQDFIIQCEEQNASD